MENQEARKRAAKIKLLLTDCDGVLTDTGVYYGSSGEEYKRFSIRDGMGVERLRELCEVDTGIVTGERSPSVAKRAEKLKIDKLHLGIKDKVAELEKIVERYGVQPEEIAYIGDDCNDLGILALVGLPCSPIDAMGMVREKVIYITKEKAGYGAFRDVAEFIIEVQTGK